MRLRIRSNVLSCYRAQGVKGKKKRSRKMGQAFDRPRRGLLGGGLRLEVKPMRKGELCSIRVIHKFEDPKTAKLKEEYLGVWTVSDCSMIKKIAAQFNDAIQILQGTLVNVEEEGFVSWCRCTPSR